MLRIAYLAGIFTGMGFVRKDGRKPKPEDCGYCPGPIDIFCSQTTGTIQRIAATNECHDLPVTDTLDATGQLATAGFVDSHTHAIFAGHRSHEYFQRWRGATYLEIAETNGGIHRTVHDTSETSDEELLRLLHQRLNAMLRCGTTVAEVKSGYGRTPADELRLLRIVKQARHLHGVPDLQSTFLGLHALPGGLLESDYCDSMIGVLSRIASEELAANVDAFPEQGFFSCEQSLRFLAAGAKHGLRIKVHADQFTNLGASKPAIHMGAISIDHLERIDEESVILLSRRPTIAVLLPASSLFLRDCYTNARRLLDAGARVAIATDFNPGSAPTLDLQLSCLLAASQMAMTASEIFCAITYGGAAALGLEQTHGALDEGRRAHINLWDIPFDVPVDRPTEAFEYLFIERKRPSTVVLRGAIATRT